jgi:hypothetical protein
MFPCQVLEIGKRRSSGREFKSPEPVFGVHFDNGIESRLHGTTIVTATANSFNKTVNYASQFEEAHHENNVATLSVIGVRSDSVFPDDIDALR